ncbi:unnamed protein product, partial [Rotaria magnacalcarata]
WETCRLLERSDAVSDGSRHDLEAGSSELGLTAEVSIYYQSYSGFLISYDDIRVIIAFRSTSNTVLSTHTIGPVDCTTNPGWCFQQTFIAILTSTRSIDHTMPFTRNSGTKIGAYTTDDNSSRVV